MADDMERAVGRLEGKMEAGFKDMCARLDRMNAAMFGESGVERRLRECEQSIGKINTQAGMIALFVSVIAAIAAWVVGLFKW